MLSLLQTTLALVFHGNHLIIGHSCGSEIDEGRMAWNTVVDMRLLIRFTRLKVLRLGRSDLALLHSNFAPRIWGSDLSDDFIKAVGSKRLALAAWDNPR